MHPQFWSLTLLTLLASTASAPVQAPGPPGVEIRTAGQQRNDTDALEDVLAEEFRAVYAVIQSRPADAQAKLAALKARLPSLKLTSAEGKVLRDQARESIATLEAQIESSRLTPAELESRFRANPDDIRALRMYVSKISTEINIKSNAGDKAAADRKFAEIRALLATVKPTSDASRTEKANLGAFVSVAWRNFAFARLKRPDLEARLRANPDDADAWQSLRYKADMEIGPKMGSDKAAAGKAIAEVQALLRSVKPTSREAVSEAAEVQKVIGGYEGRFERERRAPLESATLSELDFRLRLNPDDALALGNDVATQ